jgi:hypothetical protein
LPRNHGFRPDGWICVGETDFECWGRLWKASPSDPEVDGEEWVIFLGNVEEHFRSNYENFPDEFYFWGDFSGDRTLDLKIVKPTALTARLLSDLQKYLQMNGQKMWRIRIPIYFKPDDPHRVVVVYSHAIDFPPIYQLTPERRSWNMSRIRGGDTRALAREMDRVILPADTAISRTLTRLRPGSRRATRSSFSTFIASTDTLATGIAFVPCVPPDSRAREIRTSGRLFSDSDQG